jgi:hypothetical protein
MRPKTSGALNYYCLWQVINIIRHNYYDIHLLPAGELDSSTIVAACVALHGDPGRRIKLSLSVFSSESDARESDIRRLKVIASGNVRIRVPTSDIARPSTNEDRSITARHDTVNTGHTSNRCR